jgi:hypothetical protein
MMEVTPDEAEPHPGHGYIRWIRPNLKLLLA